MTDEAMQVIDTYLDLVESNLPEAIRDEVIAELRTIMIATAEDMSEGVMTIQSAKKAVARFGAPSEVAAEFAMSMSSDFDGTHSAISSRTADERSTHLHATQQISEIQRNDVQLQDTSSRRKSVGFLHTYLKSITLLFFWTVVTWTPVIFMMGWALNLLLIFPILQAAFMAAVFAVLLLRKKMQNKPLWDRTFPDWSGLQRLFTFPENATFELGENLLLIDSCVSMIGIILFAAAFFSSIDMEYRIVVSVPLSVMLVLHVMYAIRRTGDADPASYGRSDLIVNLAVLILLNIAISLSIIRPHANPLEPWIWSVLFSPYILFIVVTRGQDLWWKKAGSSESQEDEYARLERETARKQALESARQIGIRIGRSVVLSYVLMIIMGLTALYLAMGFMPWGFIQSFGINIILLFVGFMLIDLGIAALYLGVRYYLVKSKGLSTMIGKRHKSEAMIDLIVTAVALILLFASFPVIGHFIDGLSQWVRNIQFSEAIVATTSVVAAVMFLFLAAIARLIADVAGVSKTDSSLSMKSMVFSGHMFVFCVGLMIGVFLVAADYLLSSTYGLFLAMVVSIPIILQKAITGEKLRNLEKSVQD
jgi:hypothetical protein